MDPLTRRLLLLVAGALAGYLLLLWFNPARPSLRDGLRCLSRYPQIWILPALFAWVHGAFSLWLHWYESRVVPDSPPVFLPWTGWQPPSAADALAASALPTFEGAAAIYNSIVTSFPLSALWAALFLANWRGSQGIVVRALGRRFGWAGGGLIHAGLVICAAAAVAKPILFAGLTRLNYFFGEAALLRAGAIIDWLSFLFEYLVGVGVQIYLVALCYVWIRGLNFDFDRLRRFALRRFVCVARWALVVMAVSTVGIHLPLIAAAFQPLERHEALAGTAPTMEAARWTLAVFLLLFGAMQILLIFHNETLGQALGDHVRLLRRYGGHLVWLTIVAAVHFFLIALADAILSRGLGAWTWPGAGWSLFIHPLIWTLLASWLVASWVCLFKRCELGRPDADDLVRY